jgi:membrane-bound lytic murein transglycosylase B
LLLFPNFAVIRRYNPSDRYALAVALLARGYRGEAGIAAPWPTHQGALQRADILDLQALLAERGFEPGAVDGLFGAATRRAMRSYQVEVGLPADGWPTPALLTRLRNEAAAERRALRRAAATALNGAEIKALQAALNGLGYAIGKPTGTVGPRTRAAIRAFEESLGLTATGVASSFVKEEAETALTSRRRSGSGR